MQKPWVQTLVLRGERERMNSVMWLRHNWKGKEWSIIPGERSKLWIFIFWSQHIDSWDGTPAVLNTLPFSFQIFTIPASIQICPALEKSAEPPPQRRWPKAKGLEPGKPAFAKNGMQLAQTPPSLLSFPFPSTPRLMGHRVQPEKAIRSSYLRIFSPDLLCEHRARRLCSAEKA
jgi:hypothetical protein